MSEVVLFEHNEKAYQRLIEALKTSKCTTINHATGTGKSFISLKYLYENRDKKYLYLAPTYPIIEQLLNSCYKIGINPEDINIDTMIYRNLQKEDMEEIYKKYDGFIFDEYHRTGAEKTYEKIKQLKFLLREGNDEKKFIGLTATPIRYLDNERNMTQEIFDGNVASALSLSEAMLEGLLPVPTYINSKIACRPKLESVKNKLKRMSPTKQKEKLEEKLKKIDKQINNGNLDNKQLVNKYIKGKNGKYIIFCSTINELEKYYSDVDSWFEDIGIIKKYKVHSGVDIRLKGENQKRLDNFKKDKEGISVLFCVDILNEGVHVEDIDGIFMLRRTTSPIIYFQQIGRALSFSGRNKQIKIFDLVNNFNHHMAIDRLYQELHEEFEKRSKESPESKEKYEQVLKKFKIMDETKIILNNLSNIEGELTKEKIIESRLDYSIDILTQYIKNGGRAFEIFQNENTKKAYTTIARYDTFVNNTQFEKLLQLNILLPERISMTLEERQELLEGCNSLQEKINLKYNNCINEVIEFIYQNNRLPDLNSESEEESELAKKYLYRIVKIDKKPTDELKQACLKQKIEMNAWEKVLFDKKINIKDLTQIIELSQNYINLQKEIPEYLQMVIEKVIRRYDIKENVQLFKLLNDSEIIKQKKLEEQQKVRYELINKVNIYLKEHINDNPELLKESGILDIINKLRPRDITYLKIKYETLKREEDRKIFENLGEESLKNFCRKMRYVENGQFDVYYKDIEQSDEINGFILELIEFMEKNGRQYPSKKSDNQNEKDIADKLEIYSHDKRVEKVLTILKKDKDNKLYNPFKTVYKLTLERLKQNETKKVILENTEFFKLHQRRALPNSSNPEEKELAIKYQKKCIERLGNNELTILNNIFNNKKNFRKTCEQYVKNIKTLRDEGVSH